MNRIKTTVLCLSLLACAEARAWESIFETRAWALAEPQPITSYIDDFDRPLQSGSDGHAFFEARVGVVHEQWNISWVYQRQYVIEASRDTAVLYHLDRTGQAAPAGQRYRVDVEANFYAARGLRLGRKLPGFTVSGAAVTLEPRLNLWDMGAYEDGSIKGLVLSDASGELSYSGVIVHDYSDDVLLDRNIDVPSGFGASLDLDVGVDFSENWSGQVLVQNLIGRIWWDDSPFTTGVLDSNTRQTDANGNVSFSPTLSGFEGYRSHRQRMPMFAEARVERQAGTHYWRGLLVHTEIGTYPGFGWRWAPAEWRLGLDVMPTAEGSVTLHAGYRWLDIAYGADDARFDDAHQLQLSVRLRLPWGT